MMNQVETDKDTSIPVVVKEGDDEEQQQQQQHVATTNEIDFRKIIDPLLDHHHGSVVVVDNQEKQPAGHLAVGENLEKVKITVIEKAGEVKTTIVEKAVEVRKSIDQLLHTTTAGSGSTTTTVQHQGVDQEENQEGVSTKESSSQDEHDHEERKMTSSIGEKLESVKSAVVNKAESVRTSLVVTAEELQNNFSHILHPNNNNDHGQEEGNDKALDGETTTERTNDKGEEEKEASIDKENKNNNNKNKIEAACSWIVHKVDDLVERVVQAHDKTGPRDGETIRRVSRDLVEIISQEEETEEVNKGREQTNNKESNFEKKVDQTRSMTGDPA